MKLGFTRSVSISDAIWYLRRVCVVEIVLLNAVQPNLPETVPINLYLT